MQGRVAHLDGIRALAITCVLCAHWLRHLVPVGRGGHIGVDIFFVLSGFIITRLLWASEGSLRERYAGFLLRRARRLYPALLGLVVVATVAALLLPGALRPDAHPLRSGAVALVQLTWLSAALAAPTSTLGHTWSLGIEWLFYLLWPAAVLIWSRRGTSAASAARVAVITAVVLYLGSLPLPGRLFYYLPPARLAELLAGAALGLALFDDRVRHRAGQVRSVWPSVVALGVIATYVALAPSAVGYGLETRFVGVPVATVGTVYLLWWGQGEQRGPVGWLLTNRWVTGLGACSYSLYLWHTQAQYFIEKDWLPVPEVVLVALAAVVTVALTALSFVLLERPLLTAHGRVLAPASATEPRPTRTSG